MNECLTYSGPNFVVGKSKINPAPALMVILTLRKLYAVHTYDSVERIATGPSEKETGGFWNAAGRRGRERNINTEQPWHDEVCRLTTRETPRDAMNETRDAMILYYYETTE